MGLGIVKTSWTTVILPPYSSSIILGYLIYRKTFTHSPAFHFLEGFLNYRFRSKSNIACYGVAYPSFFVYMGLPESCWFLSGLLTGMALFYFFSHPKSAGRKRKAQPQGLSQASVTDLNRNLSS